MEFRAKTMSYSKKKRAEVKKREIVLQHNLDELDYKICNDADLSASVTKNRPLMHGGHETRNPSFSRFFVE